MKLKSYLKETGTSRADFASSIGVSEAAIARYVLGRRTPRGEEMVKIIAATSGAVMPNDFFDVPSAPAENAEVAA